VLSLLHLIVRKRHLIRELVAHDLRERYIAHVLGFVWHLLHPLLLVSIYVMVFSYLFRGRLDPSLAGKDYITYAFSGLIPWLTLQEGLSRGANSVAAQPYLTRQPDFPIEVLPIKAAIGVLPTLVVLTLAFILFSFARGVELPLTMLLLPAYWLLLLGFLAGTGFILGALTVFVPDMRDILQVILAVGLFLSPILYLPAVPLPTWLEFIFVINPFSYVIWPHKDLVFYGAVVSPWAWGILLLMDFLVIDVGYRLFRHLKPRFGDAL
jgi:lipopolysaccharide transport system permease protein